MSKRTEQECFWRKVDKSAGPEGCWLWTAAQAGHGYGHFRRTSAHRWSYVAHYGEPPDDKPCVLHKCDVRTCVNPLHLWAGTKRENMHDKVRKGRQFRGKACSEMHHGERNGRAKLTANQCADIIARYASGATQRDLAATFGVCQQSISGIIRGVTWSKSMEKARERKW